MRLDANLVERTKADLFKDRPGVEVISAVEVQQCALSVPLLAKNTKSAQKALGEPRVLVLAGEWDQVVSRVKLSLLPCKLIGPRLQVKRGYALSKLRGLEVLTLKGVRPLLAIGLTFTSSNQDTVLTFQAKDEGSLFQLLGPIWYYVTKWPAPDQKQPDLTSVPDSNLDLLQRINDWTLRNIDQMVERRLTTRQGGVSGDEASTSDHDEVEPEEDEKKNYFISAKEERDLQTCLTRYEFEVGDIAGLQSCLQNELASLEAANVQAVLDNVGNVNRVKNSLDDALALLDDVNENLATFDTKLLVMREDIAAIETRNNKLELETRNNGKLLTNLDRLLEKLQLSSGTERRLRAMSFNSRNREGMVEAGWELYDHMYSIEESIKDSKEGFGSGHYGIASLSAVSDQRTKLIALRKSFVAAAIEDIGAELMGAAMSVIQTTAQSRLDQHDSHREMPNHGSIRQQLEELTSLVHVTKQLDPEAIKQIGLLYTDAFNMLIRKELRAYTSKTRKELTHTSSRHMSDVSLLRHRRSPQDGDPGSGQNSVDVERSPDSPLKRKEGPQLASPSSNVGDLNKLRDDALKLSEAWSNLLQDWLPFLMSELDSCAEFLMLKEEDLQNTDIMSSAQMDLSRTSANRREGWQKDSLVNAKVSELGTPALEALLADVSSDFVSLVDVASKNLKLQAVRMLSTALKWQVKIKTLPMAAPIYLLLHQCAARLLANYKQCIDDTVLSLDTYEYRVIKASDGLKNVQVFPFVENFPGLVSYLGELVTSAEKEAPVLPGQDDGPAEESIQDSRLDLGEAYGLADNDEDDDLFKESSLQIGISQRSHDIRRQLKLGSLAGSMQPLNRNLLKSPKSPAKPILSTMSIQRGGTKVSSAMPHSLSRERETATGVVRQLTESELPTKIPELRLLPSIREAMEPTYAILSKAIFRTIERVAKQDAKHGERVKMQNYLAFEKLMLESAGHSAVLDYFVREAGECHRIALEEYIEQQMEYAKLFKVVEFRQGVEQTLAQIGREEIVFQTGYQPQDFQALITSTLSHNLQKRLTHLHARIIKHMQGNDELVQLVWNRLKARLKFCYGKVSLYAKDLYPNIQLAYSPDELQAVLSEISLSVKKQ